MPNVLEASKSLSNTHERKVLLMGVRKSMLRLKEDLREAAQVEDEEVN